MLVLARQKDQSIVIGDDVVITIVDIRGDKVRLGINAPREVSVHRKEIYDLVREKANQPVPPPDEATLGFMAAAIEEAQTGLNEGGLPIGSVLVRNGQIIARGHIRRVQQGNPMAHAEFDCLTHAGRQET
jgi:carbon storage regulator CsrA